MKSLIVFIILAVSFGTFAQSLTIVPTNPNMMNSSKTGTNKVIIEAKRDLEFSSAGNSQLILSGYPDDVSGTLPTSSNFIDFQHNLSTRWQIGDFYQQDIDPLSSGNIDHFMIKNTTGNTTTTPFTIERSTNLTTILKLQVNTNFSLINKGEADGKFLRSDASGNASWAAIPTSLWQTAGAGGNEIKNTNTGGFWSSNTNIVPYGATNITNIPTAPTNGAGTRLMWIPTRSAFRCGTVNGDAWDAANVGLHSFASGYNSRATGIGNIAFGTNAISDGTSNTIAIGENTQATGTNGISVGTGTNANSYYSVAMGYYNIIPTANATSWVATDPLFTIGNGQTSLTRSNAMMILKNGNVGIGTSPVALFHSHQNNNSSKNIIKLTNSLSGITVNDGLDIGFEPNVANARIWNYENGSLSIGTNNVERINISSAGNVGIGVNNTNSYKLFVSGSTAITGTVLMSNLAGVGERPVFVDANGFLIEGTAANATNTYSKYHNVSAASARNVGTSPSTNFTYMATACLAYFSSAVKKGDGQIVMPVEFPDDAILGEMVLHAVDNVSTDFLEASLIRVPKSGAATAQSNIATVNTALLTSSTSVQPASLSISPAITVDNANFYYYILVDISSGGANWSNNALALRGVRFKYSITY